MRAALLAIAMCGALVVSAVAFPQSSDQVITAPGATEALAAFDNLTNGFTAAQSEHDAAIVKFNSHESAQDGLGPLYNADSCGACHFNPVVGGISEVTELRVGHQEHGSFVEAPGGSLINSAGLPGVPIPHVPDSEDIRTFRTTLGVLGDGYVEAIADETIQEIARSQSNRSQGRISGEVIRVPVLEAPGSTRVARFGWKNQHASLLSFAADAYLNEMGITNAMFPAERTSLGLSVMPWSSAVQPNDSENDIETFAQLMRATKAPPRDTVRATSQAGQLGSMLFTQMGCDICHVRTIVTAPVGTIINGATMTVPEALGNKIIHPFSDFLLHDVGTGDGIVQNGGPGSANKFRTPPLWGLRMRNRLMHDGESLTFEEVIERHKGEANEVLGKYKQLKQAEKQAVAEFLSSL